MPAPEITTGTTVTFDSGFLAQITDLDWSGVSREAIETSHFGTTGGRTHTPGSLYDGGALSGTLIFNPIENTTHPIQGTTETVTVTFPSGDTWSSDGFMVDFGFTGTLEDKFTATFSIKMSGDLTITDTP